MLYKHSQFQFFCILCELTSILKSFYYDVVCPLLKSQWMLRSYGNRTFLDREFDFDAIRCELKVSAFSRCRKQSYLKQRRQKSVWKECRLCSRCTDLAKGPSMLGVQSGGSFTALAGSSRSLYLTQKEENQRQATWLLLFFFLVFQWVSGTGKRYVCLLLLELLRRAFVREHGRNGSEDLVMRDFLTERQLTA